MKKNPAVKMLYIGCLLAISTNSFAEPATTITKTLNKLAKVPESNNDFQDSRRGLISSQLLPGAFYIDMNLFKFESGSSPDEVNPSLWNQAKLNNIQGLFKVTDSIYQIRGFDISNMSVVEGKNGIIVIDTLTSAEAASNALKLYYKHRPKKPVVAVIYTHSHIDHFGGVEGVTDIKSLQAGKVQIIAPEGFLKHAISENMIAGNAMSRRAYYMYGLNLPPGNTGFIDEGLGKSFSPNGTVTLLPPTKIITKDTILTVAGVKMVFQLTPDTEAPAEMNIYFPDLHALSIAENSSKTLHNFYTLRGAQIRDSSSWANYLDQTLDKFGDKVQVMFAQHNWPTWGNKKIVEQLSNQRDEIYYIHDQTLRLANMGYTPNEIANSIKLPEELYKYSYEKGYYGTVKHNSKAVYQKYLGYYDSNPANLDPLPETDSAKKYVEYMGGSNAIIKRAMEDYKKGNYRWVVTVMNQVVFAEPNNQLARNLEANALEQLGYQSEAATWRNEYLVAASELRKDAKLPTKADTTSPSIAAAMTVPQFFDNLAIHLNPEKSNGVTIVTNWVFPDIKQKYTTIIHNSVLRYHVGLAQNADFTVKINKSSLTDILSGKTNLTDVAKNIDFVGNRQNFIKSTEYFDKFNPAFNIIEP